MNDRLFLSDFSIFGIMALVILLAVALAFVWLLDRNMLLKAFCVNPFRRMPGLRAKQWLIVLAAVVVAGFAVTGSLMLSLPCRLFLPVLAVVLLCLMLTVPYSLQTFHRSVVRTAAHRRYILANGGSRLESLIPSVRRALRTAVTGVIWTRSSPIVFAMVLMFCGMMIGGATMAAALLTTLLTWLAVVAASVLGSVLAMLLVAHTTSGVDA